MAAKTHFSEQELSIMLSDYHVGVYERARPFSDGKVQTTLLIQTTQGAYVLKYYENRTIESVRFETQAILYIHKKGFPCAVPIRNRRGGYMGIFREKPYVLFEYVNGHHVQDLNPQQRTQVIHTAARLQMMTQGYRPRMKAFRWNYSRELCLKLAHAEAEKIDTDNARAKFGWFERELAALKLPQSLPKGICHCDYDASNLLFEGDRLVALLDFDDANYTYLLFDLANVVDGWAWQHEQDFDPTAARQIVQEYLQARNLSDLEKRHLFDVHKLQILFDGIWFFGRGQAADFYERSKIEYLDRLGREGYYQALIGL